AEREILLRIARHIARPLTFILPLGAGSRPRWMIRLGLFFYDHLGGRQTLSGSRAVALDPDGYGAALSPEFRRGFAYADGWVDDARLVILNAVDARERGADIRTRTRFVRGTRAGSAWEATLVDR